jgi:hypothetical protein
MTVTAPEGVIILSFSVADGRFCRIDIDNRRPVAPLAALVGRAAVEVPVLVGRLFSVCRMAQGVASLRAVEGALGWQPDPRRWAAHDTLIAAETLLDHLSRICLDWPMLLGLPPRVASVKAARRALADLPACLFPKGDALVPGAMAGPRVDLGDRCQALDLALAQGVDPLLPLLQDALVTEGDLGAAGLQPLPKLVADRLCRRLDEDPEFSRRPAWDGAVWVTGALARQWQHPAVVAARDGGRATVWAHMIAVVTEMRQLSERLRQAVPGYAAVPDAATAVPGLSTLEAARGRLVHRVCLKDGRIVDYGMVAPTEWNFHPAGAVPAGLLGRDAGPDPERRVRLLVSALDPCVEVGLVAVMPPDDGITCSSVRRASRLPSA